MENKKMSATPPNIKDVEIYREEFIQAAQKNPTAKKTEEGLCPWDNEMVRKDISKAFTIRLSEVYILKLKYISEKTNKSQQKIVRESLITAIDKLLSDLTN